MALDGIELENVASYGFEDLQLDRSYSSSDRGTHLCRSNILEEKLG